MGTVVLIFAPSNLQQLAWQALLEKQPAIQVSGSVGDTTGVANHLLENEPHTILLDLPQIEPRLVANVRSVAPEPGLLYLADYQDLGEVVGLLQAGASGFVSRDASLADLARGIIAAGRGEIVLPPKIAGRALDGLARGEIQQEAPTGSLTGREQDVLVHLSQGLTNKDIAQSLFLSVRTVEAHLRNIYDKLDVSSRTEAALWAVNHGYGTGE